MGESETAKPATIDEYRSRLDKAQGYSDVWKIVRDTVKDLLEEHRVGMMTYRFSWVRITL